MKCARHSFFLGFVFCFLFFIAQLVTCTTPYLGGVLCAGPVGGPPWAKKETRRNAKLIKRPRDPSPCDAHARQFL
ncbi:hypothetical protein BC940DRAFT_313868, partial [Gongronella butleri]